MRSFSSYLTRALRDLPRQLHESEEARKREVSNWARGYSVIRTVDLSSSYVSKEGAKSFIAPLTRSKMIANRVFFHVFVDKPLL